MSRSIALAEEAVSACGGANYRIALMKYDLDSANRDVDAADSFLADLSRLASAERMRASEFGDPTPIGQKSIRDMRCGSPASDSFPLLV